MRGSIQNVAGEGSQLFFSLEVPLRKNGADLFYLRTS